jgi:hypothetical protein
MQADPRGWGEAELARELADEIGILADYLMERILAKRARPIADERSARSEQSRRDLVADDRLTVCPQNILVDRADDARMTHRSNDAPPDRLRLVLEVVGDGDDIADRLGLAVINPAGPRLAA